MMSVSNFDDKINNSHDPRETFTSPYHVSGLSGVDDYRSSFISNSADVLDDSQDQINSTDGDDK